MQAGWLNIYKPQGISSAAVVGKLKRFTKITKIGHAGTLDPLAEGILPVAFGKATKLIQYVMNVNKVYEFTMKFGQKTSTGDSEGEVIQTSDYLPSYGECLDICKKFTGEILQTPPKYSALKINGVRAYSLARENKHFILPERKILISQLKLTDYNYQDKLASYVVECSKGTYIRSLSEDIAFHLQSASFVIKLVRTRVGCFSLNNCIQLKEVERVSAEIGNKEFLSQYAMQPEEVLSAVPSFDVDALIAQKVIFGQEVKLDLEDVSLLWLRYKGRLLAVGLLKDSCFKSFNVFNILNM